MREWEYDRLTEGRGSHRVKLDQITFCLIVLFIAMALEDTQNGRDIGSS